MEHNRTSTKSVLFFVVIVLELKYEQDLVQYDLEEHYIQVPYQKKFVPLGIGLRFQIRSKKPRPGWNGLAQLFGVLFITT